MKKTTQKVLLLFALIAVMSVALCGCAGDKNEAGSSITVGIPQDLEDSLDPHKVAAAGTREVLFNIFDGLVKVDPNGDYYPALCSKYEISDDALTYTFTLRKGVKFHDGTLVTPEDVKYSIDRCSVAVGDAPLVAAYSNVKSTSIDDDKFIVTLNEPDTEFLAYMTTAIIPEDNPEPDTNPIGAGPYKFESRSPQENFVIKKFDDYYDDEHEAHIETVIFKVVGNMDTVAMELQSGAIDLLPRIPLSQAELLDDNFTVLEGTMNLVQALYLNNAFKPFDDPRVRQALCYAADPAEVMQFVSDGKGTEIGSSVFPAFGKYYMSELNDTYNTDIEKAKALLADAGYPDGFEFDITVPSNYTQHVETAQVLADEFAKIGVKANIKLIEWDSWLSDVYSKRQFESTVIGVDASSLTAASLLQRFVSTDSKNFINYNNADYDVAFANARAALNDAEKTKYYKECERILSEDAANVYIQDLPEFVAINNKYTGYEFYPLYIQDMAKLRLAE
ncbi:MAG: ABC transporter substrate-binding protein [Lachnospiraceae bacterium]|nr:ABC transporter substrate-binding protein [Lachnospiraceae bacterium]